MHEHFQLTLLWSSYSSYMINFENQMYTPIMTVYFRVNFQVDDQLKYPPSIHLDGKVQLFRSGNSNGVSTKCGIQVFFSDQGGVKVVIPRSYSQKITGLCGDCNHVHDDFRLSNGTNVAKNPHRHNLVGDSYLAQKYNDDEQ